MVVGTAPVVTDGPIVAGRPLELIVEDAGGVEVAVEVEVDVFVGELVDDVLVDELDEDVLEGELVADDAEVVGSGVPGGASLVGGVVVPDAIGVLEGRVGTLTEREALGRFEPPPHAAINKREIAQSTIARDRM